MAAPKHEDRAGRAGPLLALPGLWAVSLGLVAIGVGVVESVTTLYPGELPAHPFLVADHAALLYLALPAVVLATVFLLLAPGLLAIAATGGSLRVTDWLVRGFGLALAIRVGVHSLIKAAGGTIGAPGAFLAIEVGIGVVLSAVLLVRARAGHRPLWPGGATSVRRAGWLALTVVLPVIALLPAIFWTDFMDDGLEALEAGRSLAEWIVPRFPNASGVVGLGIGMLPMSFVVHWFYALFGGIEAAARLPLVLYLPVLFAALLELIELGADDERRMGPLAEAALLAALGAFTVTMAFNASYDPYAVDIAAPTAFETFTTLTMVGSLLFLWSDRPAWFGYFALLGYLSRPTGLLFLLFLGLAVVVVPRDRQRRWLAMVGSAIGLCLLAFFVYEYLVLPSIRVGPPAYGSGSLLERFQFLTLTDAHRLLYVLIPAGLVPPLAMAWFGRQDPVARSVTVVTALYFAFFLFPAYVALHHFTPVMVLPAIVFWRVVPGLRWSRGATVAALAGAAVAIAMALPARFDVYRGNRELARHVVWESGDYAADWGEYRTALETRYVLFGLFPPVWSEADDPAEVFMPNPNAVVHYAARPDVAHGDPRYVIRPESSPPPPGGTPVESSSGATAYVVDGDGWVADRHATYPTDFRSRFLDIPRHELFPHLGEKGRDWDVNLKTLPLIGRLYW